MSRLLKRQLKPRWLLRRRKLLRDGLSETDGGGGGPPGGDETFFGARYFGARFFGRRYFG